MAMRMYEQRQAAEGKPPSHQFAKELLAGIVGGEVCALCTCACLLEFTTGSVME